MGEPILDLASKLRRRLSVRLSNSLPQSRKVDFLLCGAQKGGTTALQSYLRSHPEVCAANVKEVHFFDNEDHFARKPGSYERYHRHFDFRVHHRVVGEATPIYMYWLAAPRRIWTYNPNMKIVVIL